ncbi:MAG: phosphate signaling complex protein PhoU [Acetobacteraceae bacterium]
MSDAPQQPHLVTRFENELAALRGLLIEMGASAANQLALATRAVIEHDAEAGARAIEGDPEVDALGGRIEAQVIRMLALRQPMAEDLRLIVGALRMMVDLERIGDYAANVAKRSVVLAQFALPFSLAGLGTMARLVAEEVTGVVEAIRARNPERAVAVWRSDQAVDDLYTSIFRELITYMMEDPRNITPCTHLLFIAKNLERIGDHATNVAETLHYAITGQALTGARPKGDTSPYAIVRAREGGDSASAGS